MINERQAVMMIEDELPFSELKRIQKKQLYEYMQSYASHMSVLGERGELKKFETQLIVANRLFTEGNDDVKEVMTCVYMSTLSHSLEQKRELLKLAEKHLNWTLLKVMRHDQLAANP